MEIDGVYLGVGDLDALWIWVGVEFAFDGETGFGCDCRDELDDGLVADQRLSTPVLGDEREEPMLDLVPFAGAWRQMANGDLDAELLGEGLKLDLPKAHT